MNHEDPAARLRVESKHPEFDRISGGHFREGADYSTWRAHGTDDWLLIHTLAGAGRVAGNHGSLTTDAGDTILIAPRARHDYATSPAPGTWEFLFAHFRPPTDWSGLLEWPGRREGVGRLRVDGEVLRRVRAALRRTVGLARSPLATAELFALNALEEALLWLDTQNPRSGPTDERVLRVVEYVQAHLADELDVPVLAAVGGLSPSRLSRLFTAHLGLSPQRFVERERLLLAKQLLDFTNRPVGVIARDVGWSDPLYFSQRFRRSTGLSPTAYRMRAAAPAHRPEPGPSGGDGVG